MKGTTTARMMPVVSAIFKCSNQRLRMLAWGCYTRRVRMEKYIVIIKMFKRCERVRIYESEAVVEHYGGGLVLPSFCLFKGSSFIG